MSLLILNKILAEYINVIKIEKNNISTKQDYETSDACVS